MKFFITFLLLLAAVSLQAQKTEVFAPSGIALNGYDVVAFYENKAVKGSDTITTEWKGVKWYFSSQANKNNFLQKPQQYEPQFGGWCAYGASRGYKAPTEAATYAIINNKLYFNYNMKVKELWEKNRQAYIDSANVKWPSFKNN
ncbi:MAG: YHS domain protein [Lacibacter sp.]|jgi:YHS domain-containing protein